LATILPQGVR